MRKKGRENCLECGVKIVNKKTGRKRIYCSKECSKAYRKKQQQSEEKGKNYKEKQNGGTTNCAYCGIKFIRKENSIKVCCSNRCEQAKNRIPEVIKLNEMFFKDTGKAKFMDVRAWALERYHEGYRRASITEALDLNKRTLARWAGKYKKDDKGNWRRSNRSPSGGSGAYGSPKANSQEEWLEGLRIKYDVDEMIGNNIFSNKTIRLVSGLTPRAKSEDSLSLIVQARLKMNPTEGTVIYVFVSKGREHLRYMYWDGSGYIVGAKRREKGLYPWPDKSLGDTLDISSDDFNLIMYGKSRYYPRTFTAENVKQL